MQADDIKELLDNVKKGKLSTDKAFEKLKHMPYKNLSFANVDTHRGLRAGFPEVVFCQGKTADQVYKIVKEITNQSGCCLATRVSVEMYKKLKKNFKNLEYNEAGRTIVINKKPGAGAGLVMVVTAGTSDIPVAEEAAVTAEVTGNKVERLYDVGVAGIHRLLDRYDNIRKARVIVAVAGMEGALPSVIGGLVNKPVIAVPTSIGYGANFKGVSALLTMLNSCASNVVVVNIDNGFGAGYVAGIINKL